MNEEQQYYVIWKLTTLDYYAVDDPRGIDYKTGLVLPTYRLEGWDEKGKYLTDVKLLSEHGNPASEILCATFVYDNETKSRTSIRKWVIDSEEDEIVYGDLTKVKPKPYTDSHWEIVQQRGRQNIINNLLALSKEFNILPIVQDLFKRITVDIQSYISTGDTSVLTAIATAPEPWLQYPSKQPLDVNDLSKGYYTLGQVILYRLS